MEVVPDTNGLFDEVDEMDGEAVTLDDAESDRVTAAERDTSGDALGVDECDGDRETSGFVAEFV